MKKMIIFLIPLFVFGGLSQDYLKESMYFYKLKPEKQVKIVKLLQRNGFYKKPKLALPLAPYISVLANEGKIDEIKNIFKDKIEVASFNMGVWYSNLKDKKKYMVPDAYNTLSSSGIKKYLDLDINNPMVLDTLWGAYYATGDTKYIDRLVEAAKLNNPLVKHVAIWSIKSNMEQFPEVKKYIEENNLTKFLE